MKSLQGKDFLSHILSPLVAVVSSTDADDLALDNNLCNFTQLVAPFGSRVQGRGILLIFDLKYKLKIFKDRVTSWILFRYAFALYRTWASIRIRLFLKVWINDCMNQ